MDGPNTNWSVLKLLPEDHCEKVYPNIIDIGSCSLRVCCPWLFQIWYWGYKLGFEEDHEGYVENLWWFSSKKGHLYWDLWSKQIPMKVLSLLYFLNSFTNLQVVSFSFTVFQKQNRTEVYSVTVAYRSCSNENNIAFFDH